MPIYECPRCGYRSVYKNDFRKHLNRKFQCNPDLCDISIVQVKKQFNMLDKSDYNEELDTFDALINKHLDKKHSRNGDSLNCRYCDMKFTARQNRWRHENNCSLKHENSYLIDKLRELYEENKKLKRKLLEYKKEYKYQDKINFNLDI